VLVVGSLGYAWMWRDAMAEVPARRILGWTLAPIAIIVGAYHGLLMAVVTARPLWNTGPTVVAALLCFAATGIAAVGLTHLVRAVISHEHDPTPEPVFSPA
jgi:formate-dependent nitrite reductase membrane component NrfD